MFDTRNDLPAGKRSKVIAVLNARLADAIDLGAQSKHAHWNVKGPNFIALRLMHVEALGSSLAAFGAKVRTASAVTANDKQLWFLEAHLYARR